MKTFFKLNLIVILFTLVSCITMSPGQTIGKIIKTCELPPELLEVSGATDIDEKTVAVVQDELGIVYFYDFTKCQIVKTIQFEKTGDFEGITRVKNDLYVLRSDGKLYYIKDFHKENPEVSSFDSNIPADDIEGLSYDEKKNYLLIAPKRDYHNSDFSDEYKAIYAYDLSSKKMLEQPFILIKNKDIKKAIIKTKDKNELDVEIKKKKKIKYYFSSLTNSPSGKYIYILMSKDHVILKIDYKGNIKNTLQLDPEVFPKPEGITFIDDEHIILTSEGKKHIDPILVKIKFNSL